MTDSSVTFHGWASTGSVQLQPWSYHPRALGPRDVEIQISHCGICASDIHTIKGEWGPLVQGTCIAGHEIIGTVVARGVDQAEKFAIGDRVGVGAIAESCQTCEYCTRGLDQQCAQRTFSFNDTYKVEQDEHRRGVTYGGFADGVRVPGDFVYKIPDAISSAEAAPLMCAGSTTYAPLAHHGAGPDKRVGIYGIGGLGHMALQWARAFQAKEVVAISTSDDKRDEAKQLGATRFVNSRDKDSMKQASGSMELLLVTSFGPDTDYNELLSLVANNGTCVLLAVPEKDISLSVSSLLGRHINLTAWLLGGRTAIRQMLDFAAKHNVRPWIETMPMSDANAAIKKAMDGFPRYRVVMHTGVVEEP